ncbi:hypothetical protein PHYBOEH_000337 [Phytophthora boehmeriae]|uniref:Uncharacterized protein n=1 Tax=Phytophthora boehmeriae TaxID=109152 RepID=A0A8T1VEG0_9STRA|nr:hypothetical protein PHYBOEH_000337 [Phytophthora boehmeriae]
MKTLLQALLIAIVTTLLVTSTGANNVTINATAGEFATTTSSWTGELKLYKNINFDSLLLTLTFQTSNLCFNLACGDMNDQISSASWKGLPLKAGFKGGSTTLLMFYRDIDCTGVSQGWSTSYDQAPDFRAVEINDVASSFMFLERDTSATNGIQTICDVKTGSNS